MKKRKLRNSLLLATILFSVLLSTFTGLIGYHTYYQGMMEKYQAYLTGILKLSMRYIDGDDMRRCADTNEKSAVYEATQENMNMIKESYEIEYIYIVIPQNHDSFDNMKYLMTGLRSEEYEDSNNSSLGDYSGEDYSPEVVNKYFNYMQDNSGEIFFYANKTNFGYMYTGSSTISDSTGKIIAVLSVDIAMDEVYDTMSRYILYIVTASILLTALFIFIMYIWMNRRIVHPLSQIEQAARKFAFSNHDRNRPQELSYDNPDIQTKDEIQSLSDAYVQMAVDIKNYMTNLVKVTAEKERIGAELDVATQIQASMLPSIFPAFPDRKEIEIYASMNPAKEVGGDFYDFFMVDEQHLAIVVADVSGKGVPAALFMVIGKTLLKDHTLPGVPLGQVFMEVNQILCEANNEGLFITAFEAVLDLRTGELEYVNAGHEWPFIQSTDGVYKPVKIKAAFVLAGMENMKYHSGFMKLEPGDKLYQYTDGVTEATNANSELYGMERLEQILNQNDRATPKQTIEKVKEDINLFVGEAEQFDDITMLCLEYKAREEADQ